MLTTSVFSCLSDEKVDLNDSKWEDIHVTTGALKMFFRELPEPLFTYGSFYDFVNAISESPQFSLGRCSPGRHRVALFSRSALTVSLLQRAPTTSREWTRSKTWSRSCQNPTMTRCRHSSNTCAGETGSSLFRLRGTPNDGSKRGT